MADPITEAEEFPSSVRRGLIAQYLDAVEPATEAATALHVGALLPVLATIIGRARSLRAGMLVFPNLFLCLAGRTSLARKSTAISLSVDVLRAISADLIVHGCASGEALLEALGDVTVLGALPHPNRDRVPVANTNRRLLLVEPELLGLGQKTRYESATLGPRLCELFDGAPIVEHHRARSNSIRVENGLLSLLTASPLRTLTSALGAHEVHSGLANRVLYVAGTAGAPNPLPPPPDAATLNEIITTLRDLVATDLKAACELALDKRALRAHESRYRAWHGPASQANDIASDATARTSTHALKVALLLAVVDGTTAIRREHIDAGWDLALYAASVAAEIFATLDRDQLADMRLRLRVVEVLAKLAWSASRRDVQQRIGGHVRAPDLEMAIEALRVRGAIEVSGDQLRAKK